MKKGLSANSSEKSIDTRKKCKNINGLVDMAQRLKSLIINPTGKEEIKTKCNAKKNIESPHCKEPTCEETLGKIYECPICRIEGDESKFYCMIQCKHKICINCFVTYLFGILIDTTSNNFECTICNESIHPNDVINIINEIKNGKLTIEDSIDLEEFLDKYEKTFLQSTLEKIPGILWCPGVDCNYAVITKGIKSNCPKVTCKNRECGIVFCSNCKSAWHKGIGCKKNIRLMKQSLMNSGLEVIKNCPTCSTPICRINDGSCNHIQCSICKSEFCWLCLKNINTLHFVTPSGCTFYGSNKWSAKKKHLIGLSLILFGPIMVTIPGIILCAFLVYYFPSTMIEELREKYSKKEKTKLRKFKLLMYAIGVSLASPFVAFGFLAIGITVSLAYIYILLPATMIGELIQIIKSKINKKNDNSI